MKWTIIATWSFALNGIKASSNLLNDGGSSLDAVEKVSMYVEEDPTVNSVGLGGIPNIEGEVELDAAIMKGSDLSIGAVAGVKGFLHPINIARKVLENTKHNLLVGRGAEEFAIKMGFQRTSLLTEQSLKEWNTIKNRNTYSSKNEIIGHDTIGVVAIDVYNEMACATSTSGSGMKLRGRVGDSPLIGSGYYVDNNIGGATATGLGEDIMKCCTCFYAVELMNEGYSPQEAAEMAIKRTHKRISQKVNEVGNMAIVVVNKRGEFGAAANHNEFSYAVATNNLDAVVCNVRKLKI